MSSLEISLLGPLRVAVDGRPVASFRADTARALLAYLAVHAGQEFRRDVLAGLLWPEEPEPLALQNLRQALSRLRKAIGDRDRVDTEAQPCSSSAQRLSDRERADTQGAGTQARPYVLVERETIQLNPERSVQTDVAAFAAALAAARAHPHRHLETCPSCIERLRQAVGLYRGEFLAGFSLASAPFEEWMVARREGLHLQVLDALHALAVYHERRGEHEFVLRYARRQLELEPWREQAHRQCMRALALSGGRTAAMAQYEACRRVLQEELGIEPQEETAALYERIRKIDLEGLGDLRGLSAIPPHNLPAQSTPFLGREREMAQIGEWFGDPACRLLSLVGPGGSGKSRLATEAAAQQVYSFRDGVFLVPLAALSTPEGIVPAIAQALELTFHPGGEPRPQLLSCLRRRELLLLLDNYEHLLAGPEAGQEDGAGLVADILAAAPGVQVLVTSRTRLSLQGERLFPIAGMEYPPLTPGLSPRGRGESDRVIRYSAVQLFLDTARRVRPGYEPTDDDLAHVAGLCRLVEGMPLAILLAAAWTDILSPAEIVAQVAQGLDFLEGELRDLPQRQRSMRAVFDASWRLLSQREQAVFAALSVFHGGFTAHAAQEVAGASLPALRSLVHKSFLEVDEGGRYGVHELLRQYGAEQLARVADGGQEACDRHAAYYAGALERWATDLQGARYREATTEVERELANAGAAWAWATERGQVQHLARMANGLGFFYSGHGPYREGELAFRMAAERVLALISGLSQTAQAQSAQSALLRRVLARLLAWQGYFTYVLGPLEAADRIFDQSASLLASPELADQDLRAERALLLEVRTDREADPLTSRRLSEQMLALYRELGDARGISSALMWLGSSTVGTGEYQEARRRFEEMLAFARSSGMVGYVGSALCGLSRMAAALGDSETAVRLATEAIGPYPLEGGRHWALFDCNVWGDVLQRSGRYGEAEVLVEQDWADWAKILPGLVYRPLLSVIWVKLHLGQYERVRALAEEELAMTRRQRDSGCTACTLLALSYLAIAEGAHAQAQQPLVESISLFRESGTSRDSLGQALGCMAYIDRELGQPEHAWACLREALQIAEETGSFELLLSALAVAALLLADQGQAERAVEVYALAWRYPVVSNSRWYQDVYGRHVAAAEAALPPDLVAAAQERGRARDPWATVRELLEELEAASAQADAYDM